MTSGDSITFIGTATTLLRIGSFQVLTDPNFLHRGQRAYLGKGLWSRRLTDPAMTIAELPTFDAILLSHLHGDHFDRVARRDLPRQAPLITTEPAAERLQRYGFQTRGLDVWERSMLARGDETLTFEALPGLHARGLMGRLLPPVMGTLLEYRVGVQVRRRILISGDTLTGDHADEIRRRHPGIDTAIVHLGGTRVLWHTVTMDDVQGVDYVRRVDPGRVIPVHYDDYGVMRSPLQHFVDRAEREGLGSRLQVVERGRTATLPPRAPRPV
jgi:L-ascorbate metabolism protein UlaG (beta-lactamase superfamily)